MSKTSLKNRLSRKTHPELIETISSIIKNPAWNEVAKILSGPTRKFSAINLSGIDENTKVGDTILIPGKVLSGGTLSKKIRVVALSFSESAKEKAAASKSELVTIKEEIKKNPKFEGVKILKHLTEVDKN